jgi:lipoate-protein ligase A
MPLTIRLLPFETLSGPANMAADEVLLEAAGEGSASLRFYAWSQPTLSLGYFQPAAVRLVDSKLAKLDWVRRPTGGAALVHDREVTYALALPSGPPWQVRGESWICRFHHLIMAALEGVGAATRAVQCGEEKKLGTVLCFQHHTPGDLVADGWEGEAPAEPSSRLAARREPRSPTDAGKVVGSAQRKRAGALLQHGGILLSRSEFTPQLPGLAELTGVRFTPDEVARFVTRQFAADTGWQVEPGEWTAMERDRREAIERERYRSAEWNEKR